ncbi:MAG: hypothetical protein ACFFEY_03620 [Candidatus Thorarchaeota archaeon]
MVEKISKKEYIIIGSSNKSQSRVTSNIFFLIVVFLILFPIFALPLKYQIGGVFSIIINAIGSFSLVVGGLYLLLGFIGIFTHGCNWTKKVIIGVVLLWVGSMCTGIVIDLFGIITIGFESSGGSGYH